MLKACIGLNCARQIDYFDRRHCNLAIVPDEVYRHERTLEELLLDTNGLQDLPPKFFRLTNLRKLTLSENDITRIPPGIANFTRLVELDFSKNALEDIPQNIQFCRSLLHLNVSSNPLLRTPETVSSITSLTQLCINDTAIPRLPMEIGNLKNLMTLEARENMIKTLPLSICQCKKLRRLDVGNNEIDLLPEDMGQLVELTELWLDNNLLSRLPESISNCSNLTAIDVSKNRLEYLPADFAHLRALSDLHLSENCIENLPEDIGNMSALTLIKLDLNHLISIPDSIGRLHLVTELLLFDNMLESVPPSLFEMKSLEMLNLDRNHLLEIPATIGKCKTLHVLSLRDNELLELPEEVGQLTELRVLDIAGNRLQSLPGSLMEHKLDALWVDSGQSQPLLALIPETDTENDDRKVLMCAHLPQQGPRNSSMENFLDDVSESSSSHMNGSAVQRSNSFSKGTKLGVAFDPTLGPGPEPEGESKLVRFPTPFRKDMKALKAKRTKKSKYKPNAEPSTTIFRKGSVSQDDLAHLSLPSKASEQTVHEKQQSIDSLGDFSEIVEKWDNSRGIASHQRMGSRELEDVPEEVVPGALTKMSGVLNLSQDELTNGVDLVQNAPNGKATDITPDLIKNAMFSPEEEIPSNSQLQTIEVTIVLAKLPDRTLGFSIAGGRGSTPAYEDVDESIFVTKIAPGGLAEQDGRLRLGDKLIKVNDVDMVNATHAEAVAALKSVTSSCSLVVSREVLVIMPDEGSPTNHPAEGLEPPTETEGPPPMNEENIAAKAIVSEVLDRSITRYSAELINSEGQTTAEARIEKPAAPAHENYVNYDVAHLVLESMARRQSSSEGDQLSLPMSPALMPVMVSDENDRSAAAKRASFNLEQEEKEEKYPEEKVVLDRSIGKLGLSIVGGADHVSRVFGQGRPGVYISKISKNGAAEATGKLRLGDRILEVNGMSVRYSTHQQAVQWLISQEGDIVLIVRHVPQPEGLQEVVLVKNPGEKLGISIRGGSKGSKGNPLDPDDEGIFISKVAKNGAADKNKKLMVGQRMLEVNGISLLGASHTEAVKALRSTQEKLYITVCDGYDPQEVLQRRSESSAMLDARSEADTATIDRSMMSLSTLSNHESLGGLDIALHNMLSASMDVLPQSNNSSLVVSPERKYAHSSMDIHSSEPVTDQDLDNILKELTALKEIEVEDSSQQPRMPTPPPEDIIPLSEIVGTLQRGFTTMPDDDLTGALLQLSNDLTDLPLLPESQPTEMIESEGAQVVIVDTEDPSSLLEALDSEVSLMRDEVTLTEESIQEQEQREDKKTNKPLPQEEPSKHTQLEVPNKPVPMASPETRRRAEMIKVELPNQEHSEQAVKSIIGEVFNDVSFEEFERSPPHSGLSSGAISPSFRGMSPASNQSEDMDQLLSALKGIGELKPNKPPLENKDALSSEEVVPQERTHSMTNPTITVITSNGSTNQVQLTLPNNSDDKSTDTNRKSAPPKVQEKPTRQGLENPEMLSFNDRLALHKRKVEDGQPERLRLGSTKSNSSIDSFMNHDQALENKNSTSKST